jgi:hypothetical protein
MMSGCTTNYQRTGMTGGFDESRSGDVAIVFFRQQRFLHQLKPRSNAS